MTNSAHAQCLFSLPDVTFNDFLYTQLIHSVAAVSVGAVEKFEGLKEEDFFIVFTRLGENFSRS